MPCYFARYTPRYITESLRTRKNCRKLHNKVFKVCKCCYHCRQPVAKVINQVDGGHSRAANNVSLLSQLTFLGAREKHVSRNRLPTSSCCLRPIIAAFAVLSRVNGARLVPAERSLIPTAPIDALMRAGAHTRARTRAHAHVSRIPLHGHWMAARAEHTLSLSVSFLLPPSRARARIYIIDFIHTMSHPSIQ